VNDAGGGTKEELFALNSRSFILPPSLFLLALYPCLAVVRLLKTEKRVELQPVGRAIE
jgi:hypothetical protein